LFGRRTGHRSFLATSCSHEFYVFRKLAKYTVFLSTADAAIAYGVFPLSQPFEDLIGPHLPVLTQTVLLPFKGVIVYDGLMSSFNISFGPGIRRGLNESFKEAKARHGIITSLPMSNEPLARKLPKAKPAPKPPMVNFLQDKNQTPYMRSTDIDHYLGTSPSSGAAKLAAIRKMLGMHQFDPQWSLPSRLGDNPMVWMLQVNGFIMDARYATREVQEIAFKQGLIPYIPADRQQGK